MASFQNETGSTNGGDRPSVGEAARQPEGCVTRAMNVFDSSLAVLDIAVLCTPHGSVQSFAVHGSVQTVHTPQPTPHFDRTSCDCVRWVGGVGFWGCRVSQMSPPRPCSGQRLVPEASSLLEPLQQLSSFLLVLLEGRTSGRSLSSAEPAAWPYGL